MNQTETLKTREEIASKDKWQVEAFYPSFTQWQSEFDLYKKSSPTFDKLRSFRGKLGENVATFREALELKLNTERAIEKLYVYAHLRHDEDTIDDKNKSYYEQIASLITHFSKECAWFEPEILSLDKQTASSYLNDPSLRAYRFYLEKILRMGPHTLSSDKEEILALVSKPLKTSSKAFSALNNADIRFEPISDSQGQKHPLSHGLFQLYLRSADRTLRKNAFLEMHGKFNGLENTLAELISGEIEKHSFVAHVRGFRSSLEAALFPHNISLEVYHNLIKCVKKGLPLLHRYVALRKKILDLSEIHFYDMYAPLIKEREFKMTYEKARELIVDSMAPLGKEYQSLLKKGLMEEGWVDVYENKNKRSGAYSSGAFDSYPYILMNYRGTLRDVFTLAHEAGHSMHSLLAHKNQAYHNSSYPIFVAEVASTFNEELLMHYLLERAESKAERLFLLNEKIEDIRATFFRQTMFAEFELMLHQLVEEGTPLTPSLLKERYFALNKEYFGPNMTCDEEIAIEWARIPHFYYNFYVYQYATGISASLSLADKVLQNVPKAAENYLAFLKAGGSLFPIDLLKLAGIDMAKQEPIERLLNKFSSYLDEFEQTILA